MKSKYYAIAISAVMVLAMLVGCGTVKPAPTSAPATAAPATAAPATAAPATAAPATAAPASSGRYPLIRFAIQGDPGDMNPWNNTPKNYVNTLIYDRLFDWVDGEYFPVGAKSYTVKDPLHWEVEIYDNITDWNGNKIAVDDILAAYDDLIKSGYNVKWFCFGSIEKIDDTHLAFTWAQEPKGLGDLDHILTVDFYSQKAFKGANFASAPVGSGVYKLTKYVNGSIIVLEANDDYWQKDPSKISPLRARNVQTIEYHVVPEAAQNVVGLTTGALDLSNLIPNENTPDFQAGGKYSDKFNTAQKYSNHTWFMVGNNTPGKPTADLNLRLAIFWAIDNVALANAVGGVIADKGFSAPTNEDYVPEWDKQVTYVNTVDLTKAKDFLSKSSYKGEKLLMVGSNSEQAKTALQVMQTMMDQIGVKVEIKTMEPATLGSLTTKPDAWDLYFADCGGEFIINMMNRIFNTADYGGEYSLGFVKDPEFLALFKTAANKDTWNHQTVDAVYQYALAHAYVYPLFNDFFNTAYIKDITQLYWFDQWYLPNACTYKTQ